VVAKRSSPRNETLLAIEGQRDLATQPGDRYEYTSRWGIDLWRGIRRGGGPPNGCGSGGSCGRGPGDVDVPAESRNAGSLVESRTAHGIDPVPHSVRWLLSWTRITARQLWVSKRYLGGRLSTATSIAVDSPATSTVAGPRAATSPPIRQPVAVPPPVLFLAKINPPPGWCISPDPVECKVTLALMRKQCLFRGDYSLRDHTGALQGKVESCGQLNRGGHEAGLRAAIWRHQRRYSAKRSRHRRGSSGNAYVTGTTAPPTFRPHWAFQPPCRPFDPAFVANSMLGKCVGLWHLFGREAA